MNKKQKEALEDLVRANEEVQGPRVVIDYAILLAGTFIDKYINEEMTNYVEELYKSKYSI